ncbi:fatty acid desaturase family protein [Nocardioides pocheonensis]|uniref:Acyl-CoA desaturase n=1 Tax=Nocardioides pocheonensis TaxID=661485 RepID=A0A3N0GMB2_9ACTN|nr:acyl-CoA desaturase [Nocardioides pocheonensis]RNM13278.1 acyl-CoA desaturase [Nocardioides pocheonensis]
MTVHSSALLSAPAVEPSAPPTVSSGYGDLAREVRRLGLMEGRRPYYAVVATVLLLAGAAIVAAMLVWSHSWALLGLAPVLAVVATQLGFLGHDLAHRQVTRGMQAGKALGLVCADLLGGMSYGWWVAKHNAHHAHPNDLVTDPDVHAGALVFDAAQADVRTGLPAWVTRHQAGLFVPMLLGEALNLHVSSVRQMFRPGVKGRGTESVLMAAHLVAYVALLATTLTWPQALAFVAVHKGLQGIYLGLSFAPGHKGMPVLDGEQAADPLLRQVLTSRNISGGRFLDLALGGLNYQIEHHLFPSMPRPNLRHARLVVRDFCASRGVTYTEMSVFDSYAAGMRHLYDVGAGLRGRSRR